MNRLHRMATDIRVGTAGWSIPRASARRFDSAGTHLQRYSRVLTCAEINSSFYRPHAKAVYAKWRDSTPADFKFAVKMPQEITHELRLRKSQPALRMFLAQTEGLVEKHGPLLMQLPPSFEFDARVVSSFLTILRQMYGGAVVCEPRHATWFTSAAASLLERHRVSRVAADPALAPPARTPGAFPGIAYFRLHGSPRMYWSRYTEDDLDVLAVTTRGISTAEEVWCVFDNTASGSAIENACDLHGRVNG